MNAAQPDPEILKATVQMKMPFGKYKGVVLANLPVAYLEWFASKGWPPGKLGMIMATVYEIKMNGLDELFTTLRKL